MRGSNQAHLAGATSAFLREQAFYVQLWTLMPHAPLNPTDEQMAPYHWLSWRNGEHHQSAATIYYSLIADLDAQVGRLLRELDELKLATNTLVMLSSDNGPEDIHLTEAGHSGVGSAGPFRGRKRSLYEGCVRVPFILRWPGRIPAGRVDSQSVVAGVDWLPTVCRLAGIRIPTGHALARKALHWQTTLPRGPLDPTAGKADYPWPGVANRARGNALHPSLFRLSSLLADAVSRCLV